MSKHAVEMIADAGLWITLITLMSFSVINIAVLVERIAFFQRNRTRALRELIRDVRQHLLSSRIDEALELVIDGRTSAVTIIRNAISHYKTRAGRITETLPLELALDNAIAREKVRIEKFIWVLGTIGAIGPLVGLFGTVLGIMRSFAEIAMRGNSGQGVVDVAAGGIWESLFTTAFGIFVAVPALIAHNYFVKRSRIEIEELENCANDMVGIIIEQNEAKQK
jgi:biopolymer transport protein ExbB/TolQ